MAFLPKAPQRPKIDQNPTLSALVVRNGWKGVERSWNELQDEESRGAPNFGLGAPKKGSKWPKIGQNPILNTLVVRNGWNGMDQSWNKI